MHVYLTLLSASPREPKYRYLLSLSRAHHIRSLLKRQLYMPEQSSSSTSESHFNLRDCSLSSLEFVVLTIIPLPIYDINCRWRKPCYFGRWHLICRSRRAECKMRVEEVSARYVVSWPRQRKQVCGELGPRRPNKHALLEEQSSDGWNEPLTEDR